MHKTRRDVVVELRQVKYLNNLIEQDHLFIKRLVKPGMGFFWYCQLNATPGLFSLGSGEEGAFLESFFAKNHQKTAKKSAQWRKLIREKL